MDRPEFEDFLLRLLWRKGDTDMTDDLPLIIRMGEARLSRDLTVLRRQKTAAQPAISELVPYPLDYHSLRLLASAEGAWTYVTPHEMADKAATGLQGRLYTLDGDGIRLLTKTPSPTTPLTMAMYYNTVLPTYATTETWVQENYFDLYTHACLINSAPYLQADERIQVWNTFYKEELESVVADDVRRQFNGSPLKQRMPGIVG